jgi:hypothetical protein
MKLYNDREEWDSEDATLDANGRPRPTRSRSGKNARQHQKPKARRTSGAANSAAKRGIHQRRNRRLTW